MQNRYRWLRMLIGISIILALLYTVGIERVLATLSNTHLPSATLVFLLLVFSILIGAWNIHILLKPIHPGIHFLTLLRYYLYGWVSSLFLPARIGDYSTFILLRKKIRLGQGTAIFLIDKFISFSIILLIGVVGFFLFFDVLFASKIAIIVLFLILGVILLFSPLSRIIMKRFSPKQQSLAEFLDLFFHYFQRHPTAVFANILSTLFRTFITALMAYYIFVALGIHVSLLLILTISAMELVAELVPFTVNGLGIKQTVGVYLYHIQGIDPAYSSSRYLLGIIVRYFFGILFLTTDHFFGKKLFAEKKPYKKSSG